MSYHTYWLSGVMKLPGYLFALPWQKQGIKFGFHYWELTEKAKSWSASSKPYVFQRRSQTLRLPTNGVDTVKNGNGGKIGGADMAMSIFGAWLKRISNQLYQIFYRQFKESKAWSSMLCAKTVVEISTPFIPWRNWHAGVVFLLEKEEQANRYGNNAYCLPKDI